jgi:uncharacterized OsmC-like protein
VRAVATIGAPSDAGHVANLLGGSLADECQGEDAAVELAGRHFTVRRDFVEDLQQDAVLDAAAGFKGAVLVLHAPLDNVVSIDHAARIFQAARHPKSFVVLDGANHLLTTAADAEYAAATIGTWAGRYLVDESGAVDAPETGAQVLVAETTQGRYLNHVVVGEHRFLADEPISAGGFDAGPNPYDLLASALGACTSMTLRMYAEHKGMEVGRIAVEVSHEKYHPADAAAETENGNAPKRGGKIDRFTRVLRIDGDYDEATRASLLRIADKCPVHRTLHQTSEILTEFE